MYDATSRQELREQIGYEGWLIQRCHDCLEKNKGIIAPLTVVIHDDGARDFHVVITDYIGAASAASLVNDMTPLIFCSSFKILDLVLEWCLRENGITPAQRAFSFSEKIRRCRTNAIKVWPDFIENSAALQTVITAMYAYCRPKRNAIVHDVWGTNVDGDLHFDYHYNDDVSGARSYPRVHDTDVVEQQAVLAFSEFSRVVQELLVDPAKQDEGQLTRLKRVCNRFQAMHGQPTFDVSEVIFYRVIRRTSIDVVDVDSIRLALQEMAKGDVEFELEIERDQDKWLIAAKQCAALSGKMRLDSSLDAYKIVGKTDA